MFWGRWRDAPYCHQEIVLRSNELYRVAAPIKLGDARLATINTCRDHHRDHDPCLPLASQRSTRHW